MSKVYLLMYQYCYEGASVEQASMDRSVVEATKAQKLALFNVHHICTDQMGKVHMFPEAQRFTTEVRTPVYSEDEWWIDEQELT